MSERASERERESAHLKVVDENDGADRPTGARSSAPSLASALHGRQPRRAPFDAAPPLWIARLAMQQRRKKRTYESESHSRGFPSFSVPFVQSIRIYVSPS